ncbi:MBL fold metallo-hydrolase [Pseudonocardia nigra]|uniref:MBL fold metallo-hydrolase n=1 Tax=Pseudonocardia nigra TaxID=1921578 RepID=UPI001C5D82C0|nr:MBL fold metallo-hydrolase [Pseudonocardia nigra]
MGQPVRICRDTWAITQLEQAPPLGSIFLNSAVVMAREPVVIDTGTAVNRESWLAQLGSLVDPADVRWIFISHDDVDHTGNLVPLLELCPRATVLTSWFAVGRMLVEQGLALPMDRVRFVNDGDAVDVGDRVLRAVLPPVYDNPTTRGLFDPATGFYWGADSFASPVPEFLPEADDLPGEHWREGFLALQRMLSPWHTLLDHHRYGAAVDRVQSLPITVAAGAHGPLVRGERIADAFRMFRELPHTGALAPFTQSDLEHWMAAAATTTAPELQEMP